MSVQIISTAFEFKQNLTFPTYIIPFYSLPARPVISKFKILTMRSLYNYNFCFKGETSYNNPHHVILSLKQRQAPLSVIEYWSFQRQVLSNTGAHDSPSKKGE